MYKEKGFLVVSLFIVAASAILSGFVSAVECSSVPTDGCTISTDTTFDTGIYNLPNGIEFPKDNNDNLLNCNGSILIGSGLDNGIHLNGADRNIIENCIIKNYSSGILFDWENGGVCRSSDSNILRNLTLENNSIGINSINNCISPLREHLNNKIINNTIKDNIEGIKLVYSRYNNITGNVLENNSLYGVHLTTTAFNIIINNNTFYQTGIQYDATNNNRYCLADNIPNTYLDGSSGPPCGCLPLLDGLEITSNVSVCTDIYNLPNGIKFPKDASNINFNCNFSVLEGSGGGNGIHLDAANSNLIKDCTIINYGNGIHIDWQNGGICRTSKLNIIKNITLEYNSVGINFDGNCGPSNLNRHNKIIDNVIRHNTKGIRLYRAENNNITLNTIFNNSNTGIEMTNVDVHSNNIFNNVLINNTVQASDNSLGNNWNISSTGNYWNDYDIGAEGCFDINLDLVCDGPYNISGSAEKRDYLPLLGVQIIEIMPIQVLKGVDLVRGKTTLVRSNLKNIANIDKNISIKLYFDGGLKDTNNSAFIATGEEIYVDLWFSPNSSGSSKEIKIELEEI